MYSVPACTLFCPRNFPYKIKIHSQRSKCSYSIVCLCWPPSFCMILSFVCFCWCPIASGLFPPSPQATVNWRGILDKRDHVFYLSENVFFLYFCLIFLIIHLNLVMIYGFNEADVQINLQKAAGLIFLLGSLEHNSCTDYVVPLMKLRTAWYQVF